MIEDVAQYRHARLQFRQLPHCVLMYLPGCEPQQQLMIDQQQVMIEKRL